MKWIFWSFVAALCVLSGNVDGAGGKRPKEVERHARRKQELKYDHRDPETREKLLCDMCPPGTHRVEHCTKQETTKCQICPENHYTAVYNKATECIYCNEFCSKLNQRMVEGCTKTHNSKCECLPGHYLNREVCSPHRSCPPGKGVARTGTDKKNTRCRKCERGYFSSTRSSTAPCQKHRDCSLQNLDVIDKGNRFRDNICADMAEVTNPQFVSSLNFTLDQEVLAFPAKSVNSSAAPVPSKLDSQLSPTFQPDWNITMPLDTQPSESAIRSVSSDPIPSDSLASSEVEPVAEEEIEEPCTAADAPYLAYSDAGNRTDISDQTTSEENTQNDISEPLQADLEIPSRTHRGDSLPEDGVAGNSSEDTILPSFADSIIANITEDLTARSSMGVAEILSQLETSDENNIGGEDMRTNIAISVAVAMITFSSITCVFVAVQFVCHRRLGAIFLRVCARKNSEADEPPSHTDKKDDNTTVEDNASVITGSDDTQSVVVDIDDDTDPKAVRPSSFASSTETLQDAFRDAQVYISEHIGINWKSLSNHLPGRRLTEVQLDCIEDENRLVADKAMKMLCKWKQLNGSKANIERMAKGLDACGQKKIARKVREMGL